MAGTEVAAIPGRPRSADSRILSRGAEAAGPASWKPWWEEVDANAIFVLICFLRGGRMINLELLRLDVARLGSDLDCLGGDACSLGLVGCDWTMLARDDPPAVSRKSSKSV